MYNYIIIQKYSLLFIFPLVISNLKFELRFYGCFVRLIHLHLAFMNYY